MKYRPCPICKLDNWAQVRADSFYVPCLTGCGIECDGGDFCKTFDTYSVHWRNWSNPHSHIQKGYLCVYSGPMLPYDITEDMVKMILTFQ